MEAAKKQRTFWDRTKRVNAPGRKAPGTELTPRDLDIILPLLADIRFVDTPWIHAFTGGDYQSLQRHLYKLFINGYIDRADFQTKHANARYRPDIYQLAQKGAEAIKAHDWTPALYRQYEHKHFECVFELSLRLGLRESDIEMAKWSEIHPHLPKKTKDRVDPVAFVVPGNKGEAVELRSDGYPFALHGGAYGEHGQLYVKEIDCDKESGRSREHNTIQFKVESYLWILKTRAYETHYDSDTFNVLFLTNNERRENEILAIIDEAQYAPSIKAHIAVQWQPSFHDLTYRPPGDFIFTQPWHRVGHPDLYLNRKGA